jgi:hypothetical protein
MDGYEQLLKALKPIIAMREEWFAYADDMPVIINVQASAQRIDYLLGATIAAYEYVIQKSENSSGINVTEWHCRYKGTNSEIISFYGPSMHYWKMNELIEKLCLESRRTGQKIRPTLQRELMFKQLEMCRMMVNYSIEGDIWNRAFGAAFSLIKLIDLGEESNEYLGEESNEYPDEESNEYPDEESNEYPDEESTEYPDEDLSAQITYLAQSSCIRLWDKKIDDFDYPRFSDLKDGHEVMLTLLGVGVDVCLRAEGSLPINLKQATDLIALYDFESNEVVTIQFETSSGVFYRERGFWWNFGGSEEEFFDDFEMICVRPEFVQHFDVAESNGHRFTTDRITPYALTYEELFPKYF